MKKLFLVPFTLCITGINSAVFSQDELKLIVPTLHGQELVEAMAKTADNRYMATLSKSVLKIWDYAIKKELGEISFSQSASSNPVNVLAIPESEKFLVQTQSGLFVVDPAKLTSEKVLSQVSLYSIILKDKNTFLFSTNTFSGPSIYSFDLTTRKSTLVYKIPIRKSAILRIPYTYTLQGWIRNGKLLAKGNYKEGYYVINPNTWKQEEALIDTLRNISLGASGKYLLEVTKASGTTDSREFFLNFLDPLTWKPIKTVPIGKATHYYTADFGDGKWADTENNTYYFRLAHRLFKVNEQSMTVGKEVSIYDVFKGIGMPFVGAVLPDAKRNTVFVGFTDTRQGISYSSIGMLAFEDLSFNEYLGGNPPIGGARIYAAGTSLEFFINTTAHRLRRVNFSDAGITISDMPDNVGDMGFDATGATLYTGSRATPNITVHTGERKRVIRQNITFSNGVQHMAVTPNGRLAVSKNNTLIVLTDLQSGTVLFEDRANHYTSYLKKQEVAISPLSDRFAASVSQKAEGNSRAAIYKLIGYQVNQPKKIWEKTLTSSLYNLQFSSDGKEILAFNPRGPEIQVFNASDGAILRTIKLSSRVFQTGAWSTNDFSADFSNDLKYIVVSLFNRDIVVFETTTGKVVHTLKHKDVKIADVKFLKDKKYILALTADNLIRLYDTEKSALVLSMAAFKSPENFLVLSPDGRFTGSQEAMSNLHFVKSGNIIELESLFEQFYTPRLIRQVIGNEKFIPPPVEIAKVKIPPTVRLRYAEGTTRNLVVANDIPTIPVKANVAKLTITAEAKEDVIQEIRLFHNGKLIQQSTRNLVVADDNAKQETKEYNIQLVPGENLFKAIALNSQRTESRPDELILKYDAPSTAQPSATPGSGLTLHLLVVGINEYKNPRYNLNYAYKDAKTFKEMIETRNKSVFGSIQTYFVSNSEADKKGIVNAFAKIAAAAGPRDMFVFYYAGHGVMAGKEKQEFFLVPHDVTQLYGADEQMAKMALGSIEMQELSRKIPAQKQLFILDACQSAGALESFAVRGATEEKAIAQLARSTGTHWLTASGSEQFAAEFDQLGHGVFTYTLLEGLKGKADNGDGRVTVNELKAYLESQVPELTQKYKGTPQYPASYGYGQDFPVSVIITVK